MLRWGSYRLSIPILFDKPFNVNVEHKLAYDNYTKDVWCFQAYGCSHTAYVNQLIDTLILQQDHMKTLKTEGSRPVTETIAHTVHSRSAAAVISLPPHIDIDSSGISRDFNDNSKTIGFLNYEVANFTFIGPDRQIQKYN